MPVVVGKTLARTDAFRPRAFERVGRDDGAGDLLLSVDAPSVSPAIAINALAAFRSAIVERQQEFDVAPAATITRTVTVVSPPDNSTQGRAIGCACDTTCRRFLPSLCQRPRLALDTVAQDQGRDVRLRAIAAAASSAICGVAIIRDLGSADAGLRATPFRRRPTRARA